MGGSGRSPAALGRGRAGQGMRRERGEEEEGAGEELEKGQSWVGAWRSGGCAGRGEAEFGKRRARDEEGAAGQGRGWGFLFRRALCVCVVPCHPAGRLTCRHRAPLSAQSREHRREAALRPGAPCPGVVAAELTGACECGALGKQVME